MSKVYYRLVSLIGKAPYYHVGSLGLIPGRTNTIILFIYFFTLCDTNSSEHGSQLCTMFYWWFYTIPRDTKDNRHSGHVGVPNIKGNQNYFVISTPTWLPWRRVKTSNKTIYFFTDKPILSGFPSNILKVWLMTTFFLLLFWSMINYMMPHNLKSLQTVVTVE